MATDPVTSACTQVAVERVVSYMKTELGYVWNYKTNFENLRTQLQKLNDARAVVQHQVEAAKRKAGDEIEQQVVNWLARVEEINRAVTIIIEGNNPANMRCFKSLCPNLKKRCQHSKEAARKTDDISKLLQEGTFDRVSYGTLPANRWHNGNYENIESRRSTLEGILNALDDPDVDMVGVYGMGGSGKTTLVKEVARIAERDRLFDRVVFVEVSDSKDIAGIQQVIAERLGLEFKEETECVRADRLRKHLEGSKIKEETECVRADRQRKHLEESKIKEETECVGADSQQKHLEETKILIILDNIWKDLDLAAVGIPDGNNRKGCRLLLTSRDLELLNEMGSKTNFPVEILEEEEACNLFMKMAGVGEEQSHLQSLAIEVAKECGGLPVAIITIAKALRNKPEFKWRNALRELRNPTCLENVEGLVVKEAYPRLRLSYTNLETEELKSIFLLCSIMGCPKDASIEELLRYVVGLSSFKAENTVEDARDKVKIVVQKLKDASLLLGAPNGETFSIHDVIHDVGIWIASSQQHKLVVINSCIPRFWAAKNQLEKCTSITFHDIDKLPESLECPQLKFFYMKTKVRFTKVPNEFFKEMPNLEVLHFVEMDLSILPKSLYLLRHLRTLNLDACRVGDIAEIKDMENLEILVISSDDKIKQLSEKIGQLTSLRLLDLRKSSLIIPPKTISRLTQLEELYMDDWYDQRQVEELDIETSVASLEELKDLPLLTALNISVKEAAILPKGLDFFQKLKRYKIVIGGYKWDMNKTSRALQVTSDTNLCTEDGVIKQLKGIEDLLLDGEQGIRNVLCELNGEGFPKLKHIRIENNPSILCIVDSMLSTTYVAFPLLETLSLSNLARLEKICYDEPRTKCFCQLRTIEVQECHKLKNLFSFSIAKHLLALQEIEVVDCGNIEEIFFVDSADIGVIDPEFVKQLHSLTLKNLPRLRRICSETEVASTSQERRMPLTTNASSNEIVLKDQLDALPLLDEKVVFPNLKYLKLHDVNVKRIWPNQLPSLSRWVQNLTTMDIKKCRNLKYVFSSSTLGSFNHLQHLEITSCKDLEELIRVDDKCNNYVEFPSLERLHIDKCPELREFIFNNKVSYPSLKEIQFRFMDNLRRIWESQVIQSVEYCPKLCKVRLFGCRSLEYIFPASIARRLLQLKVLDVDWCGIKEIVAKEGGVEEADARFSFPQLTSLYLCSLEELGCFYPGKHNTELPKLKELKVEHCKKIDLFSCQKHDVEGQLNNDHTVQQALLSVDQAFLHLEKVETNINPSRMTCQSSFSEYLFSKLKSLKVTADESTIFSHSILEKFHNLEELQLEWSSYEEIFSCEEVEKHVGMFAQLKKLHLFGLSNLKQIWKQEFKMDLIIQKLEFLKVSWCHNLINLMPPSAPFKNLKILKVHRCDRLISLVSDSTANSLMVLEDMSISYCKEMTEIIENQGDVMEGKIILSRLKSLKLWELTNLTSFYSGNYTIIFPLLEELKVYNCPELKFFSLGVMSTPNLEAVSLCWTNYKCKHHNLNAIFREIRDKEVFSILKQSFLSGKDVRLVWNSFPKCTNVFSNAKQLRLRGNDVGIMWQSQFPEHIFPKLKCLDVFEDTSTVFPFGIFERFHNLKKLKLASCSYEKIFSFEDVEKYAWSPPQIKCLRLDSLHDVKQMWKKDSKLNLLGNLESLEVRWCTSLNNVLLPSSSFENLKIMKINNCGKLISLMVASTTKSLVQLEEMQISECKMMTQVVANGGDIVEDKITFYKLKKLKLKCLSSLTSFSFGNDTFGIPVLEKLTVKECPQMEIFTLGNLSTPMLHEVWQDQTQYVCKDDLNEIVRQHYEEMIFSWEKLNFKNIIKMLHKISEHQKVFSNLEQLSFRRDEIGVLCQSQFPQQLFPKLKLLEVFEDESTVFPLAILQKFRSVEELDLNCSSYEEIFSNEDFEKYEGASTQTKWLRLHQLDNLKQMWKQDSSLDLILQNIDNLQVECCGSLVTLMPPSSSFQNLTNLSVDGCDRLMNLLAPTTAKSLVQLEYMNITNCKMMIEVISSDEEAITGDEIIFNKLRWLHLGGLSSLTSFCPGNFTFTFPDLRSVSLEKCPKTKFFSSGVLNTPELKGISQDKTTYYCHDGLNATIQGIHEKLKAESTSPEDCVGPSTLSSSAI